ncbi:T3SS effector NleG family protein, partial [Escherichia coli]|nr:T3SS effector NleG family protein [Escherichia coli]
FVKNARCSNVCSLYDKNALTEILRRNATHPLSREDFSKRPRHTSRSA